MDEDIGDGEGKEGPSEPLDEGRGGNHFGIFKIHHAQRQRGKKGAAQGGATSEEKGGGEGHFHAFVGLRMGDSADDAREHDGGDGGDKLDDGEAGEHGAAVKGGLARVGERALDEGHVDARHQKDGAETDGEGQGAFDPGAPIKSGAAMANPDGAGEPGADGERGHLAEERSAHGAGGFAVEKLNENKGEAEAPDAVDDLPGSEAAKAMLALQHAFDDGAPEGGEANGEGEEESDGIGDFQGARDGADGAKRDDGGNEPDEKHPEENGASGDGKLAFFFVIGRGSGLLGEDGLQGGGGDAENDEDAEQRDKGGVIFRTHFAGDTVNEGHEGAAKKRGDNHPTALLEEGRLALGAHGSSRKKRSRSRAALSSERRSIHSSEVWA